jgi:hypothetical protein
MNNSIAIAPVQVWTADGFKTAEVFEVRYVNYRGGPAVADCHLWSKDIAAVTTGTPPNVTVVTEGQTGVELSAQLVQATAAQTEAWTDDREFFKVLAENAGLTPLPDPEPVLP